MSQSILHGTAVALDGAGVLLRGPSGSGKSDLALRLIEAGAQLIADDQVLISAGLVLSPPPAIAGKLEVRGVGILTRLPVTEARLTLIADLAPGAAIDRLPEARSEMVANEQVALMRLDPFEASAPAKFRHALRAILDPAVIER